MKPPGTDASTDASTNANTCAYAGTANSIPNLRNYLACASQGILRFSAEGGLNNIS